MIIDKTNIRQPDRIIRNCQVKDLGSGSFPRTITVRLPFSDGDIRLVRWDGSFNLAVDDYISIQYIGRSNTYEIYSTDGATTGILNNYTATTAPMANDDSGDGYAVGSIWIDVTGDTAYICVDATLTAAVWDEIGAGGGVAPKPGKAMLLDTSGGVATEYASVAAAITAAETGDIVWGGLGSFSGQVVPSVAITIMGIGRRDTTLTHSAVTIQPSGAIAVKLINLNIVTTGSRALQSPDADITAEDCTFTAGSTASGMGAYLGTNTAVDATFINCDFVATGTSAYGILIDNSSTVLIKNGSVNGTVALDGTGTFNLDDPYIQAGALQNATFAGWYYGSSWNRRSLGTTDIYIASDEAGQKERSVNLGYTSITDHFDGSSFSGFTWATYTGFAAPSTTSMGLANSCVAFYSSNTNRSFGYKTSPGNTIIARCIPLLEVATGIRVDDGSNNNYVELFMLAQSLGTPNILVRYRYSLSGSVTGPTTLVTLDVAEFLTLIIEKQGSNWVFFQHKNGLARTALGFITASFTHTRAGLYHENTTTSGGTDRASLFDWYKQ